MGKENDSSQNDRNQVKERSSIDERLLAMTENFTTIEEWQAFLKEYSPVFCGVLAKLETRGNSKNDSTQRPIAVITGGQPGAGKSALIATYKALLKSKFGIEAVINNADFYRFCVPGSYRIATEFPESASVVTDPVVKLMRKNLMEESISQGQSIIIENTLGDTIAVDMMQKSPVHDIWLALMAVPREESLLSDFERYIKMKESSDVARLVSIEAHDKRYDALDTIATRLENSGMRTIVHSRGETEKDFAVAEYDSQDPNKRIYSCAAQAMRAIRERCYKQKVATYPERIKVIREKMEGFGMTPEEAEELKKLEEIISLSVERESGGREDD